MDSKNPSPSGSNKKKLNIVLVGIVSSLVFLGAISSATIVLAAKFTASISGANEVPPVDSKASGEITLRTANNNTTIKYKVNITGFKDATGAHIKMGKVGANGEFSFDDLSKYTKRVTNHTKYQTNQFNWGHAVQEEIKENKLYERRLGYRWTIGLTSILLLPLIVLFLIYEFFAWFAFTLIFLFVVIIYACFYRPKTWKGLTISYEWNLLKEHLKEWNVNEWKDLPEDDKMRAYIYGLGIKHKDFMKNSEKIVNSFEVPPNQSSYSHGAYSAVDFATIAYFGPMASTYFYSAQQRTASSLNSSSTNSSSSSGGGGGTGGGGGGSGAF
jgi:uncharacterized membrane protein YgcG